MYYRGINTTSSHYYGTVFTSSPLPIKQVSYSYWENIDPPVVELDGDLAVVTYHKKTISTEQGSPVTDTSVFAWASVMKNIGGNWKITGIITTDDQ